jgi:hypothetical protein
MEESGMKETFTLEELRRLAFVKMNHGPTSILMSEFGTHTEDSWEMAWANITGNLPNASALMLQVQAELDERYGAFWRRQDEPIFRETR